jgi:hypothetical protein
MKRAGNTYSTDDILMVSKMGFARLAAIDLTAAKVGVISQPHDAGLYDEASCGFGLGCLTGGGKC